MKKLLFIGFFIIVLFETACVQREQSDIYDKVERYMEIYPDSALLLLNQLPHPEKLRGENSADYALLLTQARDKNYLDSMQSDSLIKIAVDYYRGRGNKVKEGKALFYYGKVMAMKDEPTVAMQAYLDAETVMEQTGNYHFQGLLQECMGNLNYAQGIYDEALKNYKESVNFYGMARDTLGVVYGYRNISNVHLVKGNNDSVRLYIAKGLQLLSDSTERIFPSLLQILGIIERKELHFSAAINAFEMAIKYEKNAINIAHYNLSLGQIYFSLGKYEMAEKYYLYGLSCDLPFVQAGAYKYLSKIEKERNNYLKAFIYKEKSDSLLYIVKNENLQNQMLVLQRKFKNEKLILENNQLKLENEKRSYVILLFVLSALVLFLFSFFILRRRYEKRFQTNLETIRDNEQTMQRYIWQLAEYQKKDVENKANSQEIAKLNRKVVLLTSENKTLRENTCVDAVFLLDQLKKGSLILERMSAEEKAHIYDYLDLLFGNFVTRLKEEFQLTKNSLLLASLVKVGFSNKELMFIFDCEMNSVFKMKQRLKERLNIPKEDSLERFIALY